MFKRNCTNGAVIGAFFISAAPAFAELNPTIALDRYLGLTEAAGLNVAVGEKSTDGDTVRWSDIVIADDEALSTVNISWIEAMPAGQNTVRMVVGEDITVVTDFPDDEGDMTLRITPKNYEMVVGEDGDILTYSISADSLTALTEETAEVLPLSMAMTIENIGGTYAMTGEERVDGEMSTGAMSVSYSGDDGTSNFAGVYAFDSMDISFGADIVGTENFEAYLNGDKGFSISYDLPQAVMSMEFSSPDASGTINSTIAENSGEFSFQDRALMMKGTASEVAYFLSMPSMGFPPVEVNIENIDADIVFPIADPGETSSVKFKYAINGVSVSEFLWSMFDPNSTIKRTPASIRLDLDADVLWTSDIVSAAETEQPPFMPQSVNLSELFLSFGGASVDANGAGTLSMPAMTAEGSLHVEARNVIALVDALSALGIVEPMQAMMVKGMLPQFTTQGPDGPDHLISDVEAGADGSISVNGNRIK